MTLDPDASPGAIAKVQADARAGVAEASRLLASLTGAGVGMPQSWPGALDHLKGGVEGTPYFGALDPAGAPDPRTLHAGLPPTQGEKWLFSQWIRNRARV